MMWIAVVPALWIGVAALLGVLVGGCIRTGASPDVAATETQTAEPTEAGATVGGEDDGSSAERHEVAVTGAA
jgi:hypothetical protein